MFRLVRDNGSFTQLGMAMAVMASAVWPFVAKLSPSFVTNLSFRSQQFPTPRFTRLGMTMAVMASAAWPSVAKLLQLFVTNLSLRLGKIPMPHFTRLGMTVVAFGLRRWFVSFVMASVAWPSVAKQHQANKKEWHLNFMIIGHKNILTQLETLFATERFPQTSLFYGMDGSGKKSVALQLAHDVLAEDENAKALLAKSQHPDLHLIAPTSAKGSTSKKSKGTIKIEQIQELKKKLSFPPLLGKKQIVILDDAHLMTQVTANSLLKLLEEPKPYQVFIMITASLHKILITLRSRSAKFYFPDLKTDDVKQIVQNLCAESDVAFDAAKFTFLVRCFPGSPSSIFEMMGAEISEDQIQSLLNTKKDFVTIKKTVETWLQKSLSLPLLLQVLKSEHLRGLSDTPNQADLHFLDKIKAAEVQLHQHIQEQFVLENLFL